MLRVLPNFVLALSLLAAACPILGGCDDFAGLGRCTRQNCGSAAVLGDVPSVAVPDDVSLTLDKPAATAEGDLLLAIVTNEGGTYYSMQAPSGWTLVPGIDSWLDTTQTRVRAFYRVADASEPSSYTFSANPTNLNHDLTGAIMVIGGANTANPVDVSMLQKNSSYSTNCASAAATTTAADDLLVFACVGEVGSLSGSALPISTPVGMTQKSAIQSTGGARSVLQTAVGSQPEAGTVQKSAVMSMSLPSIGVLIAIAPSG